MKGKTIADLISAMSDGDTYSCPYTRTSNRGD